MYAASYPRCVGFSYPALRALRRLPYGPVSPRPPLVLLRAANSAAAQPAAASPLDLLSWVVANGGRTDGLTVANLAGRDGGSGWGLKAEADIEAGTKVLELPRKCHLTYDHKSTDPRLLKLIDAVPEELWGAKLALQLLAHRLQGTDSNFATYIANLPLGVPGIPMFFGRDAIAAIEYPPVVEQIKKRGKWLYEFSRLTLAKLPGTSDDPFSGVTVDINAMGWALACVTSRAFRTRGPAHPASCLPLIDMANHSFSPNVEVSVTDGGIGLFAKHKLTGGEPLVLSYGPLGNDFLFMDYGFVIADNPHDRVQLRFDIDLIQSGAMIANLEGDVSMEDFTPATWQMKMLKELQLVGPGANTEVTFGGPTSVDPRLLAAARILFALSKDEVKDVSLETLGKLGHPLNRRNEKAALRALSGVAALTLSRFTTSLDQDEETLLTGTLPAAADQQDGAATPQPAGIPLSSDMLLAIRFRMEKKKILSGAIQKMGLQVQGLPKAEINTPQKGKAPTAATQKGFGKQPSK